jgi:acyl dehydratase
LSVAVPVVGDPRRERAFRSGRFDTWNICSPNTLLLSLRFGRSSLKNVGRRADKAACWRFGEGGGEGAPMALRYLEDFPVGAVAEYSGVHVTAEEIVDFAKRYDPQPFHIDAEVAKRWPYGGLIASGWHTAGMAMRVLVEQFIDGETSLGSPGLGPLRWKFPVRPGDVLSVRVRVIENRRSQSKPDRGTLVFEVDVLNQNGEIVMTIENWIAMMLARPA